MELPAGYQVRPPRPDDVQAIHAVMTEAFLGQENAANRPYDEWVERHETAPRSTSAGLLAVTQ